MNNWKCFFMIFVFVLASCSTATFQPFTNLKYAQTKKIDLYTDEKPSREYIEIGRIIVDEDVITGEKNMVKWALEKAQQVGADGLIWIKEDKQFYAIPSSGSVIAGNLKQIIFVAIKYKEVKQEK